MDILGVSLRSDRIDGVVVRQRFAGTRVLGTFSVPADTEGGVALRAKLRELGVRPRRVHVGLPRRLCVAKAIELPGIPGANLRRMVGFELERHLPFPPAEAVFDFDVLGAAPGRPVRVLLVATERRVFERVRLLLRDAGLLPRLMDVTIHSLGLLAAARDRTGGAGGRVVVHVEEAEAELVIVRRGRLLASRAVPLPEDRALRGPALAREVRRSLESLAAEEREEVTGVTVIGDSISAADWSGLPTPSPLIEPPGLDTVEAPLWPALALAFRRPRRDRSEINLAPEELRPRPFPWPVAITASLAAATLLIGASIPMVSLIRDERALARLDQMVTNQAAAVRRVEQLAAQVEGARRELDTLRGFEKQGVGVLPVLRELTDILPPDVWLANFSADRNGVELTGFAGAASGLIPLLEASPTLERVEFTSPVTKGRDREQFRLKAAWKKPHGASPAEPGSSRPPVRGRPGRPAPSEAAE